MSVDALHDRTTVRVLPAHESVRLSVAGVVGAVVSRMIDWDVRFHGVPLAPVRSRPEIVLVPFPDERVHASVVGLVV